jgi:hypothetical protein
LFFMVLISLVQCFQYCDQKNSGELTASWRSGATRTAGTVRYDIRNFKTSLHQSSSIPFRSCFIPCISINREKERAFANTCTISHRRLHFFGFHFMFAFMKREAKAGVREWDRYGRSLQSCLLQVLQPYRLLPSVRM